MSRLLLSVFATTLPLLAQDLAKSSARVVAYEMTARLDAPARSLRGTQRIVWRNQTGAATDELRFHLYWNAFADRDSTFMREAGAAFRAQWEDGDFGAITLERIAQEVDGGRRELRVEFLQPDDGNPKDRTVARVKLATPIAPGDSITLETEFVAKAPKALRRAGWAPGGSFFCMHWFPKLGVLEQRDGRAEWNCPQFHANTEFFADFGSFVVTLDVPAGFVVGASGGRASLDQASGDRRVLRYEIADVHDFAWVAGPNFVEHIETFAGSHAADDHTGIAPAVARFLGIDLATFDLPKTELRLLLQAEHDTPEQVRRHMSAAREALWFYGMRYGPWPYPVLTMVDPARDAKGQGYGGGMEYPTLITCGTDLRPHPRKLTPEGVTIHEFGHQYWYGLSANDEFRDPWLDEGLNSYSESRAQVLAFGGDSTVPRRPVRTSEFGAITLAAVAAPTVPGDPLRWLGRLPLERLPAPVAEVGSDLGIRGTLIPQSALLSLLAAQPSLASFREVEAHPEWIDRARFLASDVPDSMLIPGWQMISRASYSANAYTRPATILRTLERMVGRDRWWAFLRRFHTDARFAHPTAADFITALERDCGTEAAGFFRSATEPMARLDYAVHSVSPADGRGPEQSVIVRNFGTLRAEVGVRFRFEGRQQPEWRTIPREGTSPWTEFRFRDEPGQPPRGRLNEVWIDPPGAGTPKTAEAFEADDALAGVLVIDADLRNNVWRARLDPRPSQYVAIRALLQAQVRLLFAALIG
jgi:hypothetical protein